MRILHSKHQKLILQCYPAGKTVDKKPNPSELSYLLYYALTRRVKLEKVISFLDRKTYSDVARSRAGNLQVTLKIVESLIERCSENLNVFASHVCSILQSILKTGDLSLCKSVLRTYGTFCSKLDSGLFSGDKTFVDVFSNLTYSLIEIGDSNLRLEKLNLLEWKMISIMTCRYLSSCLGYSTTFGKKFIKIASSLLIDTVITSTSVTGLLSRLTNNVNVESDPHRLFKIVLTKTNVVTKQMDDEFYNDSVSSLDITEEAFRSLKALFNTTLTSQISEAIRAVLKNNFDKSISRDWGCTFLEMCTSWIPVQLRFVALSTLLSTLLEITEQVTPKASDYEIQNLYADYVLGLVSSEVNMIGLSISDIIQQLLKLQSGLFLKQSDILTEDQIDNLSTLYSQCISNLSTHIYYFDQVPDSIQEILLKINSVLDYSIVMNDKGEGNYKLVLTLLDNISRIFNALKKKPSLITRNRVNLEHWEMSLEILSQDLSDDSHVLSLSRQQIDDIQIKFLNVFIQFLNDEMLNNEEGLESDDLSSSDLKPTSEKYCEADYNQYISDNDNFITHFLTSMEHYMNSREVLNIETVSLLVKALKHLIAILGINFTANFIPFFYHWLLPLNQNSYPLNQRVKDTVSHIIFYHALKDLDHKYPTEMKNYTTESLFYADLLVDIEYRKFNKLWVDGLDTEPSDQEIIENRNPLGHLENGTIRFNSTKQNLQEFISGNSFISDWLDPHRPLLLGFHYDKIGTYKTNENGVEVESNNSDEIDVNETSRNYLHYSHQPLNGFGLGTAGDISSIHSEILVNGQSNGQNGQSNGASHSFDRYYSLPKVSELKDIVLKLKYSNGDANNNVNHESVLRKQLVTDDVNEILSQLDCDSDGD
ncbi:uncharacterized protein PRCAT00002888001 [Priceomyces carsonii]|uniref:uncharacterized protein n=1 Tax=Priceomyces carsonii TaxID=28549 RepID=UPI002ED88435|nr:unnamed protein product [Priceomyces carsonii]